MKEKGYFLLRFAGVSSLAVAAGLKAVISLTDVEPAPQNHEPGTQGQVATIVGERPNNPKFLYVENVIRAPRHVYAHAAFCESNEGACETSADFAVIAWDEKNRTLAEKINKDVNARITYKLDIDNFGVSDKWAYPDKYGDCEDYALEKRRALILAGFPPAALLTAYVMTKQDTAHAVLIIRTEGGDKVLDNSRPWIADLNQTSYDYKYVTDPLDSRQWRDVTYINNPEPKGARVATGLKDKTRRLADKNITDKINAAFSPVEINKNAGKFDADRWGAPMISGLAPEIK